MADSGTLQPTPDHLYGISDFPPLFSAQLRAVFYGQNMKYIVVLNSLSCVEQYQIFS